MRILMLCQYYPPAFGGIGRFVEDLGAELVARGHEVAVVTLWNKQLPEFEVVQGVRVYRIRGTIHRAAQLLFSDPGRIYAPPVPDPELLWALRRIIARERPQIVHGHDWLVHSFLPLKGFSGARLLVTLHDYNLRCAKWTLMYDDALCPGPTLAKCLGCAISHFGLARGLPIVLSSWVLGPAERAAVDMFVPVSSAVALGNGLVGSRMPCRIIPAFMRDDVSAICRDLEVCLVQLPAEGYLLFVGALVRNKGVDVLLRAYEGIADAPPLVLIGYEVAGESVLPRELPKNVIVLKHWPQPAVMEAWRRATMALVPSVWPDPCPKVAIEAMFAGCPLIASRIGGLTDIAADGETGILVPPGDAIALRRAIESLLADPELRARMGRAALQKVADFRAATVVPRYERAYRDLIQQ